MADLTSLVKKDLSQIHTNICKVRSSNDKKFETAKNVENFVQDYYVYLFSCLFATVDYKIKQFSTADVS